MTTKTDTTYALDDVRIEWVGEAATYSPFTSINADEMKVTVGSESYYVHVPEQLYSRWTAYGSPDYLPDEVMVTDADGRPVPDRQAVAQRKASELAAFKLEVLALPATPEAEYLSTPDRRPVGVRHDISTTTPLGVMDKRESAQLLMQLEREANAQRLAAKGLRIL